MADIQTTRAIAWGWIEYPWPLPSGTRPGEPIAMQRRQELRALVKSELAIAGFTIKGPISGVFYLTETIPSGGHVVEFEGEFVEMCKFASDYLTERGNDDG